MTIKTKHCVRTGFLTFLIYSSSLKPTYCTCLYSNLKKSIVIKLGLAKKVSSTLQQYFFRVSFSISRKQKIRSNQHVLEHKANEEVGERYSALLKQFLFTIFDKTTVNNLCQSITPCIFPFPSNIRPLAMLLIVLLVLLITRKEIKTY